MTIPDGIAKMCPESESIVQTSSNAGIMRLREDYFSLKYLTETIGGEYIIESDYPAWEYRERSKIRDIVAASYAELFDKQPKLTSIHAGLECGIIFDKLKGIDIVSIGPDLEDVHTPKEKLSIPSTERTWRLLLRILEKCADE